jgi:eukaryotic translation initiation factor 2C
MYDPVHSGKKPRSAAATIEARLKSIKGTGLPVCEQKFPLKGRNGAVDMETTVQAHFSNSEFCSPSLYGLQSTDYDSVQD